MQVLNVIDDPHFESTKANKTPVLKSTQLATDALYLKPGQSHGPFKLPERDRAVIVVQGTGELVLQRDPIDERIPLKTGTTALIERATWHAILNTGTADLIVVLSTQFPVRVEERG